MRRDDTENKNWGRRKAIRLRVSNKQWLQGRGWGGKDCRNSNRIINREAVTRELKTNQCQTRGESQEREEGIV